MYRIKITEKNRRILTAFSPLLIKRGYTPIYDEKKDIVEFVGEQPLNIAKIILEELETSKPLTVIRLSSIINALGEKGMTAGDVDTMFGNDKDSKLKPIEPSNKSLVYPAMLGAAIYLVRKYYKKKSASLLQKQYKNFYNTISRYGEQKKFLSDLQKLIENLLFPIFGYKRGILGRPNEILEKRIKKIMTEYQQLYEKQSDQKNIDNLLLSPDDIKTVIDNILNKNFSSQSQSSTNTSKNSPTKQSSQINNNPSQTQTKGAQISPISLSLSNITNKSTKTSASSTQSTSPASSNQPPTNNQPSSSQTTSNQSPTTNQSNSPQPSSNQPSNNAQANPSQITSNQPPNNNQTNPPKSGQNTQSTWECRKFSYVIKDKTTTYELCGSKEWLDTIAKIHEEINNLGKILSHKRILINKINQGYISDKNLNDMLDKLKEIPDIDDLRIKPYSFEYSPVDLTKAEVNKYNPIKTSLAVTLHIDKAQNQTAKLIVKDLKKAVEEILESGKKVEKEEAIDDETKKKIEDIIIYLSELIELRNKLDEELHKLTTVGMKSFTIGGGDFYNLLDVIAEKNEALSKNDSSALEIYQKIRDLEVENILLQEDLKNASENDKIKITDKIEKNKKEIKSLFKELKTFAKTGASTIAAPLKKATEQYNKDLAALKKNLFTIGADKIAIEYSLKNYSNLLAVNSISTAEDITTAFNTIKQDYEEIIGRQLLLLSYYTQATDIVLMLDDQLYTHFKLAYYALSWGQNTWSALGIAVKTVWDYIFRHKKRSLPNLIKLLLRNLARDNGVIVAIEKSGKRRLGLTESWNIKNFFNNIFSKVKNFFNKYFGWIKTMKKQLLQQQKETEEFINKLYTTLVESVVYGVRLDNTSSKYLLISPQRIGLTELPERTERIFRETNFNKPVKWKPLTKRYYKYFLSKYFLALTEELSEFDTIPEAIRVEIYYNNKLKKGILQYKFFPEKKSRFYPAILLNEWGFDYFYKQYKKYWKKMTNGHEDKGVISYYMVLTEDEHWLILYELLEDLKKHSSAQIQTPLAAQAIREEMGLYPPHLYEI